MSQDGKIAALIVAAGPFTNFAVAVAILAAFNFAYGKMVVPPVIGVGAKRGNHPKVCAIQVSTGATTGRSTMSPQRP